MSEKKARLLKLQKTNGKRKLVRPPKKSKPKAEIKKVVVKQPVEKKR